MNHEYLPSLRRKCLSLFAKKLVMKADKRTIVSALSFITGGTVDLLGGRGGKEDVKWIDVGTDAIEEGHGRKVGR